MLQICAGGESPAGSGQDDHPDVGVLVELPQRVLQLGMGIGMQGVQGVGTVDPDLAYAVLLLNNKVGVFHRLSSLSSKRSAKCRPMGQRCLQAGYLPGKFGFLFSMKELIPSLESSVWKWAMEAAFSISKPV